MAVLIFAGVLMVGQEVVWRLVRRAPKVSASAISSGRAVRLRFRKRLLGRAIGVRFGAGRIAELPDALKVAGINKPLLVTDAGLAALPVTQNTLALLKLPLLRRAVIVSGLITSGWDLYGFYVPIYGHSIGLSASMIGISVPSPRLARFEGAIGRGQILLMVDLPPARVHLFGADGRAIG